MRRYFESLRPADVSAIHSVPDGIFLVRVDRAQYRWHKQKPYYEIRFAVLKPRRSRAEDLELLEDLARNPEKRKEPLRWGLG
jgi:hypothetical protein